MTPPRCPRCDAAMVQRTNRGTGSPFWGCPRYPRCRGTVIFDEPPDQGPGQAASQGTDVTTLQTQLRQVTRERDTLRAGYDQLLGEVRQLRRSRPPPASVALIQELTRLLTVIHPDKWGGESAVATALTQEVLQLRERLQEGRR